MRRPQRLTLEGGGGVPTVVVAIALATGAGALVGGDRGALGLVRATLLEVIILGRWFLFMILVAAASAESLILELSVGLLASLVQVLVSPILLLLLM
jgi:hypothetical protein